MKALQIFKVLHTSIAILCLLIIGLFVYEKNVVTFSDYADIYAVIPAASEFEGDEPIGFFIYSDNPEPVTIQVREILMCDYADDNGFGIVSSQSSLLDLSAKDMTLAAEGKRIDELRLNQSQIANQLRSLISKGEVSDFMRYDSIPKETSQCFAKFRFTKYTENFSIEKSFDAVSYPFDYIWYYRPRPLNIED